MTNRPSLDIGSRRVGFGSPTFIVAEVSGNHGGSFERAIEIIQSAASAGADAIKLQTYKADTITMRSDSSNFRLKSGPWQKYKTMWDLYDAAHTPWEWHAELFQEAQRLGLEAFSSPFDETSVDFLESLSVPAYKVASPEINHIPLLEKIGATGKPVILSTGLATLEDVQLALETLKGTGTQDIAILKCTTAYPAPVRELNLRTIPDISKRFSVVAGLSDHSVSNATALAAVSLGASIVEKHFTLEDGVDTVDSFFSATPADFEAMVAGVRFIEEALGTVSYSIAPSAASSRTAMRSLYVSRTVRAGSVLTSSDFQCVRPSGGLHPKHAKDVIGRIVRRDLVRGEPLLFEDFQ